LLLLIFKSKKKKNIIKRIKLRFRANGIIKKLTRAVQTGNIFNIFTLNKCERKMQNSLQCIINYSKTVAEQPVNVSAAVSDVKNCPDYNSDNEVDCYLAQILSNSDYPPFVVSMTERSYNSSSQRHGFNGKENDSETETMDFGARLLDGNLGVWLAVDPLAGKYPDLSPYNFAGNLPVLFIDIDGMKFVNPYKAKVAELMQNVATAQAIYDEYIKNNPGLSLQELKDSQEVNNLNSAQAVLIQNQADAQRVDNFINTLMISNRSEYDYFETLKDDDNNEIMIVINLKHEQGRATRNKDGFVNAEVNIFSTRNSNTGVYGVVNNTINITLYQATNVFSKRSSTQKYSYFANELGDIQYCFKNVKDDKSHNLLVDSCSEDSPNYWNNREGAGHYSRKYEKERVRDVKKTEKKQTRMEILNKKT